LFIKFTKGLFIIIILLNNKNASIFEAHFKVP